MMSEVWKAVKKGMILKLFLHVKMKRLMNILSVLLPCTNVLGEKFGWQPLMQFNNGKFSDKVRFESQLLSCCKKFVMQKFRFKKVCKE